MSATIGWGVDALIASALLMAAVLLVRGAVRRAFGPQVAYALWALPLLRFGLPALPAGWWRTDAALPISRAGETITVLVIEPARATASATGALPIGLALVVFWAVGAAVFLGWHLAYHRRFCRRMLAGAEPVEEAEGVTVVASAAAPGPLAFGVWRRYVAFPRDFAERYDAEERALALAHELGHHARRDLLANWAALVVLALHWFNPLAWRAFHAFRADQELANDARVLVGCSPDARHAYGRAIVKAAHGSAVSAACHLHTIADLKGRLRMLTTSTTSRRRLAAGSAAVALLIAAGLAVTASSSQAAEALKASVGDALQVAPPAPPVAPMAAASEAPVAPRHVKRVTVVKDGKATTYEGMAADTYIRDHDLPIPPAPPTQVTRGADGTRIAIRTMRQKDGKDMLLTGDVMPQVSSATCPGDARRPVVDERTVGDKRIIVICTNRIEAMTKVAEQLAVNNDAIEHTAMASARVNLAVARAAIERERNLTPDQRAQALAGIAQADAELNANTQAN